MPRENSNLPKGATTWTSLGTPLLGHYRSVAYDDDNNNNCVKTYSCIGQFMFPDEVYSVFSFFVIHHFAVCGHCQPLSQEDVDSRYHHSLGNIWKAPQRG
ncbi:hypothetical protein CEXT_336951 [Caerostris extrusa]|uniref:Uncharacterized protein n=1 Tax=Caerostris extrusa TaxID=172846 RepID=A0AAV4SZZ4_CAEEX|nr:hypothetical protein CEXT_336951 [Caerostris extrusa]